MVSFFYVMPLKITTPPRLFRSGLRRGNFQPALISMVSLHGFSIPILLTQSNLKSALLFSCTSPFSGACVYYIPFRRKSQTYVCVFLRKCKKIFRSYPQFKSEKQESMPLYNENPHAAMTKGAPQAGQRGRLFRGGLCCNDMFLLLCPFGFGGLNLPVERLWFSQFQA